MTPIRIDGPGVEPVSLSEMRGTLRLDPDDTAEDALVQKLVTAARAAVEIETRRVLVPGRFRLMLTAWPADGVLPVPLSPLGAPEQAGLVDAQGAVEEIDLALFRVGPDPWEAPCLLIEPGVPLLLRKAALIEVSAGCGEAGPPAPAPLVQAIRMCVAQWFEHRGDDPPGEQRTLPAAALELIGPHRLMRL